MILENIINFVFTSIIVTYRSSWIVEINILLSENMIFYTINFTTVIDVYFGCCIINMLKVIS